MLTVIVIGTFVAILVTAMNGAADTAKGAPTPAPPLPVPQPEKPAPPAPPEPKRLVTTTTPRLVKTEPVEPAPAPKPAPAPQASAATQGPMYPVGLTAKLKGVNVEVLKAWLDGQGGAHYEVSIKGTPFGVYDTASKAVSESFLRDTLKKQVGAPLEDKQAFPVGVEVYRNGQGGKIESAVRDGESGGYVYQIKGWGDAVTQEKLMGILRA